MVVKIVTKEREVSIPDGSYEGFNNLKYMIGGHPNGISSIGTSFKFSQIVIDTGFSVVPNNDGSLANEISMIGKKGRATMATGQMYGHGPGNTTIIELRGLRSEMTVQSQGETMTFRQVKR